MGTGGQWQTTPRGQITIDVENERRRIVNSLADCGISTADLARGANVNRTGLSHFLNHGGNPTVNWLNRVLAALDRMTLALAPHDAN